MNLWYLDSKFVIPSETVESISFCDFQFFSKKIYFKILLFESCYKKFFS